MTREQRLERAWAADAYAKEAHTYEAWMVAADAFEEAGEHRIATRLREEALVLRTNWPTKTLLHFAIVRAERVLSTGKRPTEKLFRKATDAAFDEIRRTDRLAGTSHHRKLRNSNDIYRLARRAVRLARRMTWVPAAHFPKWAERIDHRGRRHR